METKFLDGVNFYRPEPNLPKFIKGKMAINVSKFKQFLKDNESYVTEKGYLWADLKESKDGNTLYFALNTWKPEKKEVLTGEAAEQVKALRENVKVEEDINVDDIPF